MAKFLFCNVPRYGQVNPTLAVVQELVVRGEQVVYCLTEDFRRAVEATGARLQPYRSTMFGFSSPSAPRGPYSSSTPARLVEESRYVLSQLRDVVRMEKPDCVIYDPASLWGYVLAQMLGVPAIQFRPGYVFNEHFQFASELWEGAAESIHPHPFEQANKDFEALCRVYSVNGFPLQELYAQAEALNVISIPKAFQPAGETFDERFRFVGPSIVSRLTTSEFPLERINSQPALYISLGTVFNNRVDFFNTCFEAFGGSAWQVVQAIGQRINRAQLKEIPGNFMVYPFVPQLEVLQYTDIFITHGELGSIMESLYYGVPLIVVPQTSEEAITARRVEALGLGLSLDTGELHADVLKQTVNRIASDSSFRVNTKRMQRALREGGGYHAAADAIVEFNQRK
ncbi:glycosyl transferase [Ktedonobacter sp. SOSP1-85]|uniref:macrolide family glycosyltransferase n=1 Tax=Ktedonobacter sp. SOSP1-85 TaxID=2778367 RepID=UPI001916BB99|nr:macrolide family glycosyltransferase [Ktedonobacter sp. SOSP1-85]GHO78094.1 glycosyl transferase [Ktedonobacter sp. SOSP1-85]